MQPLDTLERERTVARVDVPNTVETQPNPPTFSLTPPHSAASMHVTKRNGGQETVDVNKIVRAVSRSAEGLHGVDPLRVALKTIGGLYDGATTQELDQLSIRTAAALTAEEPEYGQLAARLLGAYIDKEVSGQEIQSFSQSVVRGAELGILNERLRDFVATNARKLNDAINPLATRRFEYFGLRTVYDRYLLRHPQQRLVIETPQHFFMRIACALGGNEIGETLELYRLLSSLEYIASSPTLFNAGTAHEQLSSCYLLDSPVDSLESIYDKYADVAKLSKFAGGIGLAYSRVRSRGSLIKGTNGHSNGLLPWLKTLDASVAAVNQGGKRKGAACVYLESWHADIEDFLELRDNTGEDARRAHNLNIANWIPDEFMRRVESDGDWSLFDPKVMPQLVDSWGKSFDDLYRRAEANGQATKTIKARELYARMMRTLAQTGNGWMTFKDRCNATSNQTAKPDNMIHLSNLCTEILEVSSLNETAVCNLGSVNLARHVVRGADGSETFDFDQLAATVRTAVRQLNRVIDLNFYPIETARTANMKWRPVGLGVMGLQDVFFKLRLPFDAEEALALSSRIAEEIYFHALSMSTELAETEGAHPGFAESRAAGG
ncbi:MAG: ribonucleoside-diphosphate reductase subunit alpha, partial [Rhodanobacter sp.]